MRTFFKQLVCLVLVMSPLASHGMLANDGHIPPVGAMSIMDAPEHVTTQRGGKSLSEAVAQVKRDSNVERIISARTETSGNRETHVIKALYKNGQVKTHRIPGKSR